VVALVPYLLVLLVIPLGPGDLVAQPLDIGLFFVLAVVGVGVVAVLIPTAVYVSAAHGVLKIMPVRRSSASI